MSDIVVTLNTPEVITLTVPAQIKGDSVAIVVSSEAPGPADDAAGHEGDLWLVTE